MTKMAGHIKVLHVAYRDIAGVPSLLTDGLRNRGIEADLLLREQHPCRFSNHYKPLNVSATSFLLYVLICSKNYDIVHLHGLPFKRRFNIDVVALKVSRRKLIVHLHGEIRRYHRKLSTKVALQISDKVLVSTPDLLRYWPSATWLPNPIDPIFKPMKRWHTKGKALYFWSPYDIEKSSNTMVKNLSQRMGLELTILNRKIPYRDMPKILNNYEYFFGRFNIPSLSKTALEALACGCKVISWKGLVTNSQEILKKHNLQKVIEKLMEIYKEVLETG